MSHKPSLRAGAQQIISRCLCLEQDQQLVIFLDETTVETALILSEAAVEQSVPHTLILVPVSLQQAIPAKRDLSLLAQGAAREARAIVMCVNGAPECLPFRRRMLETNWTARTRVGHMPGAIPEVLGLADVDFDRLIADCWCMEVAMARGRRLELISYASNGEAYSLRADIGSWERLPVASDGVIGDGAWGNIPSGETYIAPLEDSGEGSVVINGSVPGMVVQQGAEIVLNFERGRLASIDPADAAPARWLQQSQIDQAKAAGDPNWFNLAEIGVGMNPAVKKLTGNMLFDEKAARTAHIALGTNAFMGGCVAATIHCDMVTCGPTLRIDDKVVLERGELVLKDVDWQEHYSTISLENSPLRRATQVARSGVQASESGDGRLQRILRPEPGRVSACFVGDPETAQIAYSLYSLIPDDGEWLKLDDLTHLGIWEPDMARRVLHLMWSFGLIDLR
jgi:hypothetical protein